MHILYIYADNVVKVNQEETTLNGLVFVSRKLSAYALHKYIEELCIWDQEMYFIRSSYMIGGYQLCDETISRYQLHDLWVKEINIETPRFYDCTNI